MRPDVPHVSTAAHLPQATSAKRLRKLGHRCPPGVVLTAPLPSRCCCFPDSYGTRGATVLLTEGTPRAPRSRQGCLKPRLGVVQFRAALTCGVSLPVGTPPPSPTPGV